MSAFAGVVTLGGPAWDRHVEDRLRRSIATTARGAVSLDRSEDALFGRHVAGASGRAERAATPCRAGSLFAATARLDNRDELGAALGIAPGELGGTPDRVLLLRMLERWGDAGIARCVGAFAFAYWDAEARRLVLGRDCLGNHALFFHHGRGFVAFSTSLPRLLTLPEVPRALDERILANYLALNLTQARQTFYSGIERVPSRTVVAIDRGGVEARHYWSPRFDAPPPFRRDQDYVERARELLDRAVADATRDTPQIAISASGGFDSSAVAATAARLGSATRITCYTLAPPPGWDVDVGPFKYRDESDKIAALVRMHPSLTSRIIRPEAPHAFEEDDRRFFARTGAPTLNPGNLGWFSHLHDAALADGHPVLLNGTRGNLGLTWRGDFALVDLLRRGKLREFAAELPALARNSGRSVARVLAADVIRRCGPLALKRLAYRLMTGHPDSVARFSALNPAFVAEANLPRQWRDDNFLEPWFQATGWDAARFRARFLFDRNQFARDTYAMSRDQRGFEQRDPLGDRRLLEFALAVPEPMYRRDGVPRSFARAVLADRLPREVLDERRSGAQAGAWFRRLDMRKAAVAADIERLEASPLARRLLDLPRLKRLVTEWPHDEHAAEKRKWDYHLALARGLHVGNFVRWVEGGNG